MDFTTELEIFTDAMRKFRRPDTVELSKSILEVVFLGTVRRMSNGEIAEARGNSIKTVEAHFTDASCRLGLDVRHVRYELLIAFGEALQRYNDQKGTHIDTYAESTRRRTFARQTKTAIQRRTPSQSREPQRPPLRRQLVESGVSSVARGTGHADSEGRSETVGTAFA